MKTEYILAVQMERVLMLLMPQNRLIMEVELHTGLRVGDIVELPRSKIATKFWVTERKTGKRRQVGLTRELVYQILEQSAGSYWAFPSPMDRGQHKTRQAVWADVKRAAKACRLPQNVGTHTARKIYAVELLAKYGDIERVRRALNHGSSSVTLLYAMADKLAAQRGSSRGSRRRSKA